MNENVEARKGFSKRGIMSVATALALCFCMGLTVFAQTPAPEIGISSAMLEPVVDSVTSAIGVVLPVGLAIFAIFLSINIVPKLFKKFAN